MNRDPLSIAVEFICKALEEASFDITVCTATSRGYNSVHCLDTFLLKRDI